MPRARKDKNMEEVVNAEPTEDTVAAQLKKLGADLIAVADDQIASKETISKIEGLLSNLSIKDFPKLAESEVVQTIIRMLGVDDMRPGEIKGRGTLAERDREWTWPDVQTMVRNGTMEMMTFQPAESLQITWNGLTWQTVAGEMQSLPRPWYDIYMEHIEAQKQAKINEAYIFGRSDVPPHINWQTPEAAKVRLQSLAGRPYGVPGGTVGVGVIPNMPEIVIPAGEDKND